MDLQPAPESRSYDIPEVKELSLLDLGGAESTDLLGEPSVNEATVSADGITESPHVADATGTESQFPRQVPIPGKPGD